MALRQVDTAGRITVIGDEPHLPYERPALSKGFLDGSVSASALTIRNAEQLRELSVELLLGRPVVRIDPGTSEVMLDDGRRLPYDRLLLATGSRARRLNIPGSDLAGIHYLRTLDDSRAVANRLHAGSNLVVIGAGFIGLEVAATARERFGCSVWVIEVGSEVLQRGAPSRLRHAASDLHRANGVEIFTSESASGFSGNGAVESVSLASGRQLKADCVVIGIGVVANTELAQRAGIEVDDGIVTDASGETSVPRIFAAGEVAAHDNQYLGGRCKSESWQVAQYQSVVAGRAMAGVKGIYSEIPWFWTDQFGVNFQFIGDTRDELRCVVRSYDAHRSTAFYLNDADIVGALCTNSARDIGLARAAITKGIDISPEELADPEVKLKPRIRRIHSYRHVRDGVVI